MKRIRHTPEQIIRQLREADAELAQGVPVADICKKLDIAENTYYRWRNQFGGIKADEMKRLRELEKENARLKALVADLSLDKVILKLIFYSCASVFDVTPFVMGRESERSHLHSATSYRKSPLKLRE